MKQTECKVTVDETAGEYSPHKLLTLAAFLAEMAAKADPEKVRQYVEKKREEKTA